MSLLELKAKVQCDGCAKPFEVDLDPAYELEPGQALFDAVEDAVRGGQCMCSLQADKMLCPACTRKVDDSIPEDRSATAEEVAAALDNH